MDVSAGLDRLAEATPARLERALGLPAGGWKRRRLYGLRVRHHGYENVGILPGDLIVVEPGSRAAPGRKVVVRAAGTLRLGEVAEDGRPWPTGSTGWLPLGAAGDASSPRPRVVGTVIDVLRPAHNGVLHSIRTRRADSARGQSSSQSTGLGNSRSLGMGGPNDHGSKFERLAKPTGIDDATPRSRRRSSRNQAAPSTGLRRNFDEEWSRLHGELVDWRSWVETMEADHAADREAVTNWRRLETKLATLLDCVRVVHGERMSEALLREAEPIAGRMRQERWRARGRKRPSLPARDASAVEAA